MANTSYLTLTNTLLRRLNEVTIEQADFAAARGVQAMAKDVINSSIETINMKELEWPFNATSGSQVLTAGTEEYNFPNDLQSVKWNSFHLTADDALDAAGHPLKFISRDTRNRYLKNDDDVSAADGLNQPLYVFEKQGYGFGLSPSPDEAYTVTFEYFSYPTRLEAYDDLSTIYPMYDEVIIQGALYHFYMFRDNSEQAGIAEKQFNQLLNRMRTTLINKEDRMISTFINKKRPSGGVISNDYFRY